MPFVPKIIIHRRSSRLSIKAFRDLQMTPTYFSDNKHNGISAATFLPLIKCFSCFRQSGNSDIFCKCFSFERIFSFFVVFVSIRNSNFLQPTQPGERSWTKLWYVFIIFLVWFMTRKLSLFSATTDNLSGWNHLGSSFPDFPCARSLESSNYVWYAEDYDNVRISAGWGDKDLIKQVIIVGLPRFRFYLQHFSPLLKPGAQFISA